MKQFSFLLPLLLFACTPDPGIVGTWEFHSMTQNGEDVKAQHDPYGERFIAFHADSTFQSGGRPFGSNTGKYVYDEAEMTLFLDSDAGEDDDSHWNVRINGDTMVWNGYGSRWAEAFTIVQIRK